MFFKRYKPVLSPTICVVPWMHMYVNNDGDFHPCCNADIAQDPISDKNGKPYKSYVTGDMKRAWNSDYMKELRRQMIEGEKPQICERCFLNEEHGIPSYRVRNNRRYPRTLVNIGKNTSEDFEAPHHVRFLDLRLGNLCNLKCRMCYPVSSRKWVKEWNMLFKNSLSEKEVERLENFNWFESKEFWNNMKDHVPYIDKLHLAGGEPLLIDKTFDFLQTCIEHDSAKKIHLTYNTNFTVLPEKCFDYWKHFKKVTLMVSIDGVDEVNRYIRYPTDWKNILKNMDVVRKHWKAVDFEPLQIICTVQIHNAFNLTQIFDFVREHQDVCDPNIYLNLLTTPDCYSIQVLPDEMKKQVKEKLLQYKKDKCGERKYWGLGRNIESVVDFMMQKNESHLLPEFRRRTTVLDRSRKESLAKSIPQLSELMVQEAPQVQF